MSEPAKSREERIKEAEDRVALFLNGGKCTTTEHVSATNLDMLLMLKHLRLRMPHQSSWVTEIEQSISKELKKAAP